MPTGSSRARPPSWLRPETWGEGGPAAVPTGPGAANVGARTASVHTGAPPCRRGLPGRPRRNAHASGVGRRFAEKSSPVGRRSGRCLEPTRRGVDRRPPERQPVGSVPGAGPGRRGGITPRRPSTMGSREPDRRWLRHGAPRCRCRPPSRWGAAGRVPPAGDRASPSLRTRPQPGQCAPRCWITAGMVFRRMATSSPTDQRSIYSRSSSTHRWKSTI